MLIENDKQAKARAKDYLHCESVIVDEDGHLYANSDVEATKAQLEEEKKHYFVVKEKPDELQS